MSETSTRRRTVRALRDLHAVAVENGYCHPGTPDVNYVGGWIECKEMRRWPKVPENSPIVWSHPLSVEQRQWIKRRTLKGGRTFVLLQVGNEWLLWHGPVAAKIAGIATRPELISQCHRYWPRGLIDSELLEAVRDDV